MSRPKRTSPDLDKATERANNLASIDPKLDLGNGLTLANYLAYILATRNGLDAYNKALSSVDGLLDELEKSEKGLADLSERMLAGVASKFGKDSVEYEKAGGKRKSEKAHPKRGSQAAKAP